IGVDAMADRAVRPDLDALIEQFLREQGTDRPETLEKLAEAARETGNPGRFTLAALSRRDGAQALEALCGDVIRAWASREKGRAAAALRGFLRHLRERRGVPVDPDALPLDIPDMTQRRLDMLKFLQTPRTMTDLEDRYLTSSRTLRGDLSALMDGWEVLGMRIRIRRVQEGRNISYNSTVHPVLLPLNLTEAYALAAGFPRLAEGTMLEEIARYLAGAVRGQLSGYARSILRQSMPGAGLSEEENGRVEYRQESDVLEGSRANWLLYAAKRGIRCRVTYAWEGGKVDTMEGRLDLRNWDMRNVRLEGSRETVPLERVVAVEPLEPYQ
ncbi:MAG TPA: hypothetical protein VLA21_07860, partial [Candidatus Limnocylindria bacterium]|nr:hypothetical protein [Candidatus Limnocylindria bacterium]